jgi:DNA-binding CsgD family transcriptional regulator
MPQSDRPASLSGEPTPEVLERLTPAERQVFDLAIEGHPTRAIADKLNLSEATIRSHLTRIYAKLGVRGRVELLTTVPRAAPRRSAHDPRPTGDMPGEDSTGSSLKSVEGRGFVNGRSGRERFPVGIVVLLIVLGLMLALPSFYFACGVLGVCGVLGL